MSEDLAIHKGHRKRLRETFLEQGPDALQDVNLLELLLFYALPQRDTNPLAHRLIDTFGTLPGVFDASVEDLMDRGGLSENTACLIKLTIGAARRYEIRRSSFDGILETTGKCAEFLLPYFFGSTREEVYALALDGKCRVLDVGRLAQGDYGAANLSPRTVVGYALRVNAVTLVLAHNHTSGIAVPSKADVTSTQNVASALKAVGVMLADHIVVAGQDYVSMLENGDITW